VSGSFAQVSATFEELADSGYARMSMDAIARRAGVGKAALYRRWTSKEAMLVDLIGGAVRSSLPATPNTGALRTDLREMFGNLRTQLSRPLVARIGPELLTEASRSGALGIALREQIAKPRRAVASTVLRAAIDRGELPSDLDEQLGMDLLMAPLAFRLLIMGGPAGDAYLDTLTRSIEAALRAAKRGVEA
jgi:AcrR family transcriptional regulator